MQTFIAVQCFQCSTMQVKQQKKSSNKWICVVCNEKQSVRKVFAQGGMAKDVRKFVQNFNMSRQFSDQKQLIEDEMETSDSASMELKQKPKPKRRNDWTEYVDDDREEQFGEFEKGGNYTEGDGGFEPMVVTEIPKALFKKPKLKDYSSRGHMGEKLIKPVFSNRSNSKKHQTDHPQGAKLTEFEQEGAPKRSFQTRALNICRPSEEAIGLHSSERASKWNSFRAQIQDPSIISANKEKPFVQQSRKEATRSISTWSGCIAQDGERQVNEARIGQVNQTRTSKGLVSKWSSFLTEEEEDDDNELVRVDQPKFDLLEPLMNVEKVEDDIHPDFL